MGKENGRLLVDFESFDRLICLNRRVELRFEMMVQGIS